MIDAAAAAAIDDLAARRAGDPLSVRWGGSRPPTAPSTPGWRWARLLSRRATTCRRRACGCEPRLIEPRRLCSSPPPRPAVRTHPSPAAASTGPGATSRPSSSSIVSTRGSFHRPLALGGAVQNGEGGRVTELVARPLLNLHFPALSGFVQRLAGEIAIERDLFRRFSVPVGYGVEIAMLIDCLRQVGLDSLAQVDLGARQNRHQSLRALSAMAFEVMVAVERRTGGAPRPGTLAAALRGACFEPAGGRVESSCPSRVNRRASSILPGLLRERP
jgi:hypothetical protein